MKKLRWFCVAFAVLALAPIAHAQQVDSHVEGPQSSMKIGSVGALSPLLLGAALAPGRALALGESGYDSARSVALFDSAAEIRVWGPLALRAGVTYSDDTRRMRPSFGARVQLLHQALHGVDGSLSTFFKTEGFNEVEGEIETTLAVGRRFENFCLLGNLAYGQDLEGNERDGELRASVLNPRGRAIFGIEARGRAALGPQHAPNSALEPRLDVMGGPIAMVSLSSLMLFAEVGPSALKLEGTGLRWGVTSLAGVGSVF